MSDDSRLQVTHLIASPFNPDEVVPVYQWTGPMWTDADAHLQLLVLAGAELVFEDKPS